jgi:hypothetical protein
VTRTKSQQKVDAAFRETRLKEPARVTVTRWYEGDAAAEKQLRAIALDKARDAGARIPRPKKANKK